MSVESITATLPSVSGYPATNPKTAGAQQQSLSFSDLIDTINPLQHIPIVSSIYRAITGDAMSPTAEIFGGALFGGIVGAVSSIADVIFTQATGKRFGDTMLSWLGLEGKSSGGTLLANAKSWLPSFGSSKPSLAANAIDPGIATRAGLAYRSAIALQEPAPMPSLSLTP